jgi:predicted HicB family RNase H-like nuclease
MDITGHIEALRADLAITAGIADEHGQRIAEQLGRALEPALRLRLLDILAEAALELNGQLQNGQVELRMAGRDVSLTYSEASPQSPPPPVDDEQAARITLRLPESLKTRAEAAATGEGISLNTWLVRATAKALERGRGRSGPGQRLTGYTTS